VGFYKKFWLNTFKLEGRTRRKEFWPSVLITWGLVIVAYFLIAILSIVFPISRPIKDSMITLVEIVALFPLFSISVRRFHDCGRTMAAPLIIAILDGLSIIENIFKIVLNDSSDKSLFEMAGNIGLFIGLVYTITFIVTALYALIVCLLESDKGPNKYGAEPEVH